MLEAEPSSTRSGIVFLLSVIATGVALLVGFGVLMTACANSLSRVGDAFGSVTTSPPVQPIAIPQSACPYLRLVATAATNAGAPWHVAFEPAADWNRFSHDLAGPLVALDDALTAAVPNVPAAVAQDLREVQRDVQRGRVQLLVASSVTDYMGQSNVVEGYTALGHASALVGNACGVTIAPPLPF